MTKWRKIAWSTILACSTVYQLGYSGVLSSVKVEVYQSEKEAYKIAKNITDFTYIKPTVKHVQTSSKGKHFEIFIDELSSDKAMLIASALRENLKLNPTVTINNHHKKRKPRRVSNTVRSTTSVIQLKKSKTRLKLDDESLENDFAEAKFREEIAREKAEREAKEKLEAKRKAELAEKRRLEIKRKAEEKARKIAEAKAKRKAAKKARLEAKRKLKAKKLAEIKAKREEARKAKLEAKRKIRAQKIAAAKAKREATFKKIKLAKEKAKHEAELKAKKIAEAKAKRQAELKAKEIAEAKAKRQAELKAKKIAEAKAKRQAELKAKKIAEAKAKRQAELKAKKIAEAKAKREAEQKAKKLTAARLKREAEQKARRFTEAKQKDNSHTKIASLGHKGIGIAAQATRVAEGALAISKHGTSTLSTVTNETIAGTKLALEIAKNAKKAPNQFKASQLKAINDALINLKKTAQAQESRKPFLAHSTSQKRFRSQNGAKEKLAQSNATYANQVQHTLPKAPVQKKAQAQIDNVSMKLAQYQQKQEHKTLLPKELPKPKVKKNTKHLWNVKDADIRSVIATVSEFTGRNFVIDPRVQGKVTIISKTPLDADEIYAAFLSALQVNSYSAIDQGDVIKIVPTIDAKSMMSKVDTTNDPSKAAKDSNMVRVVTVKHVPVQQMIPVLRPLMPQWASLSTYVPSNKIIISGKNGNLDKLVKIIREVDTDHLQQVSIVPIHYGQAEDIAKTLRTLYTSYDGLSHRVAIAADNYSNSLLISGAPAERNRIKDLITELDSPNNASLNASTQVIYLKYLQAKDLVPILAGVAKSMFSGRVGTTIGSMTIENAERISVDSQAGTTGSNSNTKEQAASSKSETAKGESGRSVEIIGEPNTNSIIINGPPNVLQTLRHVIRQIDIRPAQIIVEALITEISEDEVDQLGIDWGSVVSNAANVAATTSGFQKNIGIITKHGFEDFQAILRMMAEDNKANILSTPSIMVLDNHKAHIAVGNEVSIENSQYYNNGNQPTSTFERKKVALALDVTPQINQGDAIRLLISHANNTLQNSNDTSGRPIFNVNEINTSVIINNGDVLVLGGLIKNEVRNNDKSVPLLGHIPIIGRAFHDKSKNISRRKLMVFLHPLIIKNKQDSRYFSNLKYDFIREAQLGFMNQFMYHPENKKYVLPKLKVKQLPKPFKNE